MMTREDDSAVDLHERADMANAARASLFVSVHNNAAGDSDCQRHRDLLLGHAGQRTRPRASCWPRPSSGTCWRRSAPSTGAPRPTGTTWWSWPRPT